MSRAFADAGHLRSNDFLHDDFCYAEVAVELEGVGSWSSSGAAKRHSDDRPDQDVGILLAYGRALESLGRRLQRVAEGQMKHKDDLSGARVSSPPQPRPRVRDHDWLRVRHSGVEPV